MRCKKGVLTGQKAIGIIFLIVGVMLMFFIISQGVGLYTASKSASDRQGMSSLQCFGFIYTVKGITATDEELQFEFRNEMSSTEDVHNLTIIGAGQSRSAVDVSIPIGSSLAVRVPVRVEDNFTVYADNCELYPLMCTLEGECAYRQ